MKVKNISDRPIPLNLPPKNPDDPEDKGSEMIIYPTTTADVPETDYINRLIASELLAKEPEPEVKTAPITKKGGES